MSKRRDLRNENILIDECIAGRKEAQKELFRLYSPKLLGICARYCSNLEDAKDALHDGFVKILTQIERFNHQSKLETWMTRIMINTAIDHFKASTKFNLYDDHQKVLDLDRDAVTEADWMIDTTDTPSMGQLMQCIKELPEGYRIVFNLYAIEGYSHKEIAQKLGISEGTSKSQLARARKMLMTLVTKKGIVER